MASNNTLTIPKAKMSNESNTGLKRLVGKKVAKNVKFMGEDVKINKLTISQVTAIQAKAKVIESDPTQGFEVMRFVVRTAVDGAAELTDEDFDAFPLEELTSLSDEIMRYSGLGGAVGDKQGK